MSYPRLSRLNPNKRHTSSYFYKVIYTRSAQSGGLNITCTCKSLRPSTVPVTAAFPRFELHLPSVWNNKKKGIAARSTNSFGMRKKKKRKTSKVGRTN
jgi:hypothetical protein